MSRHAGTASSADARTSYAAVLRDRQFGPLFCAHLLSLLGDRLAVVAVSVLVYARTGSALLAAATYATGLLPWLLGAPFLAALSDRWPRRRVMVACDLARALLLLPLAVPGVPLPVVLLLLTAVAWLGPAFEAARASVLPEVLPEESRYVAASALTMLSNQSSQVLGLAGGGALLTVLSPRSALLLDSASFAVSALLVLLFLRAGRTAVAAADGGPPPAVLRSVVDGAREVLRDDVLRAVLLLAWLVAAVAVVPEGLAVVAADAQDAPAWAVGVLMASVPAGQALGAVVLGRVAAERRTRTMLPLAVLCCAALALSALPLPWPALAVVWGVVGVGSAVQLPASSTFMLTVPDALRARGFGLAQTGLMAGQALALLAAGAVAEVAGPGTPLLALAVVGLGALALLALRWPLKTAPAAATTLLRRHRAVPRATAVDVWIGVVAVASAVAVLLVLQDQQQRTAPWHPPLWLLAVLFFATGSYVATIRVGRQAHVLQLDAVPKLIGLFFVSPAVLMGARLLGVAVALVGVRRQRGRKLLFNLASFGLETSVAIAVFRAVDPGGVGPRTWLAALAATLAADLVSAWAVGVVIGLAEGRLQVLQVLRPDRLAVGTALGASTVGVIAVTTLWHSPSSLALLAVLVGLAALGQRAFTRLEAERQEQERLQHLLGQLSELEPGPASTSRALAAVRDLLEVEAVAWCRSGTGRAWTTARVDGSERALDPALLRSLEQGLRAHDGVHGPVVHVEPAARSGWRRKAAPAHVAVLLPTQRPAADDAGPADDALPAAGQRLLVASGPLHDSRADAGLVRLVQTAAELLDQAATRVEHREQLLLAARQDALTGLATLAEFRRHVQARLDAGEQLTLLLLNLRRLRAVNEVFGRDGGDRVIAGAGERAAALVPDAVLGRVGGHHLACVVPLTTPGPALHLGRRLRAALEVPLPVGSVETEIGVRVGISLSTLHGDDVDLLLRRAETAADSAEEEPFGVALYDPEAEQDVARALRLVSDLRTALRTGVDLQLVYQPQIDLASDRVVGSEALLRWRHPELGPVAPDEFIGLAESTGLIAPLLDWVLDHALAQSARWRREGLPSRVAVNLSPLNLLDDGLVRRVAEALDRHDVDAGSLVLEVTETSFMAQPLRSTLLLDALRELGVGLSVDDFGTGYSNLTYLRELPVGEVKLDRTFVQAPPGSDPAGSRARLRDFLAHAVGLVHALGLHVVVEGIEDQETLVLLRDLGADSGQGYHVCRPLPAEACTRWLRERADQLQRPHA